MTRVLDDIDDIHFAELTSEDVVRHSLVGRIVDAYTEVRRAQISRRCERDEASEGGNRAERAHGRAARTADRRPKRGRS